MSLRNKRILITGGPTWVALDSVRVISNTATGQNSILLAQELARQGARVTLILGSCARQPAAQGIRVIRFSFFDELRKALIGELKSKRYDALIHSAAVSDYQPVNVRLRKVSSDLKTWTIRLKPTPKIIDEIRKLDPCMLLVGFKYEPRSAPAALLSRTRSFLRRSQTTIAVANTFLPAGYLAFITDGTQTVGPIRSRKALAKNLVRLLKQYFGKKG
ncbi:MAG: phosphopantothenoylcysteine decarboxylase [Candidatus Omnitrophica bacterium]|nr:phosphopantothenoylcysteine decarboxylase [Candidatus Omnitrophota bacterium]